MNQRIFELVEKAELYQPGELMTNWDEEDYVVSPEELKKFAQLIIQECLAQCTAEHDQFLEVAAKNNGRESDFAFGSVNSAERIQEAIKKQFGIE